jgi:hypothetical protein
MGTNVSKENTASLFTTTVLSQYFSDILFLFLCVSASRLHTQITGRTNNANSNRWTLEHVARCVIAYGHWGVPRSKSCDVTPLFFCHVAPHSDKICKYQIDISMYIITHCCIEKKQLSTSIALCIKDFELYLNNLDRQRWRNLSRQNYLRWCCSTTTTI